MRQGLITLDTSRAFSVHSMYTPMRSLQPVAEARFTRISVPNIWSALHDKS